jgi:carbonic anhydrase
MCPDSGIQNSDFKIHDVNDLFIVSNIGNQLINTVGPIDYGIPILKIPVLLVICYFGCGIDKVNIDHHHIKKELDSIILNKIDSLDKGVIANIHNQIDFAIDKFQELIKEDKLVVIGAVDDFQNVLGKGIRRFIIVNVNGENDPSIINNSRYLKDLNNIVTLDATLD